MRRQGLLLTPDRRLLHRRRPRQQSPNLLLETVNSGSHRGALIRRRTRRGQCRRDRVPRYPQLLGDRPPRQPLGPAQPPNLRPILHCDHTPHRRGSGSQFDRSIWLSIGPPSTAAERPGTQRCDTRVELRLAIALWIETKYNRNRRQHRLDKRTPVEFERMNEAAHVA